MSKATARKQVAATQVVARRPKINLEPQASAPSGSDEDLDQDEVEQVTVIIPVPLRLTLDNGVVHDYPKGTQKMPLDHAQHWFAVARGVTIVGEDE